MHVETVVLLSKKTGESRRKSIKIDGFPTSQKSGKSSFLLQKWFSGGKPVKNRALLVWKNRSTSKMNTQPT